MLGAALTLPIGNVAGALGIDVTAFTVPQPISLNMIGGVRWVRVYTQIYDHAFGRWVTWGSVDRMKISAELLLTEYDSSLDKFVTKQKGYCESEEIYSSGYDNYEARNQQAVLGMLNHYPRHTYVGGCYMYYGTTLALIFNQYQAVSPP
jgi:hypothetical protein